MQELKELFARYLPEDKAEMLAELLAAHKDITVILDGIQGATGKTTVCRELRRMGYRAEEAWKLSFENRQVIENDRNGVSITVTLNKLVPYRN